MEEDQKPNDVKPVIKTEPGTKRHRRPKGRGRKSFRPLRSARSLLTSSRLSVDQIKRDGDSPEVEEVYFFTLHLEGMVKERKQHKKVTTSLTGYLPSPHAEAPYDVPTILQCISKTLDNYPPDQIVLKGFKFERPLSNKTFGVFNDAAGEKMKRKLEFANDANRGVEFLAEWPDKGAWKPRKAPVSPLPLPLPAES